MMDGLSLEAMKYIIARLIERGGEAAKDANDHPDDKFKDGRRLAYYEMLDIIQSELTIYDADLKSMGMDFDVDVAMM